VDSWPQYWSWTDDQGDKDVGIASTLQFLLLPDKVVVIYPPDSILSQIGLTGLHLGDLLAITESHNQALSTEQLIKFSQIGQVLISSLATTVEEDDEILHKMEHILSQHPKSGETEQLRDLISAVGYRMHVKESTQTAIDVAEHVLTLQRGASEL